MSQTVLITGGAGYKGTLLVPMLLDRGYEVTVLDQFRWGMKPLLHFASHPRLRLVTGDVRDETLMKEEVSRHDWICHLASIVGYVACAADPVAAQTINVDGTRNVTSNMSKDQRLLYASTGSTYGKVEGICTEETPINPLSLYGSTKWEGEQMARDVGGVGLRFATVFGIAPRLRLDLLVNDFVYQALHLKQIVLYEGHFRRTFLHAHDAAAVYPFAMEHFGAMSGGAYNVGDDEMNYTKREIAHLIKDQVDYHLYEADVGSDIDARDYEVSYDRIKSLGYACTIDMRKGISELVKVLKHIKITSDWRNA